MVQLKQLGISRIYDGTGTMVGYEDEDGHVFGKHELYNIKHEDDL